MQSQNVTHLLVEPGPTLARAFLASRLADRVWVFDSPKELRQPGAPAAEIIDYPPIASVQLDGDTLTEYLNPASEVYFASTESADLAMARRHAR